MEDWECPPGNGTVERLSWLSPQSGRAVRVGLRSSPDPGFAVPIICPSFPASLHQSLDTGEQRVKLETWDWDAWAERWEWQFGILSKHPDPLPQQRCSSYPRLRPSIFPFHKHLHWPLPPTPIPSSLGMQPQDGIISTSLHHFQVHEVVMPHSSDRGTACVQDSCRVALAGLWKDSMWIVGPQRMRCHSQRTGNITLPKIWERCADQAHYRPWPSSVQFSRSVVSNSLQPMDSSTPGFPVHHQLLEFAQTHVHWVDDVIQPSHPLSSPSPSAFNLSQHQGLFQWVSSLHHVAKVLEFQLQHQSFQ